MHKVTDGVLPSQVYVRINRMNAIGLQLSLEGLYIYAIYPAHVAISVDF